MPKPDHRSQMARAWLHSMLHGRNVEAGVQPLRVDWPVYPRRAKHNTVAEGGNRRWAETARQKAFQSRWPRPTRGPAAKASAEIDVATVTYRSPSLRMALRRSRAAASTSMRHGPSGRLAGHTSWSSGSVEQMAWQAAAVMAMDHALTATFAIQRLPISR